MAKLYFSHDVDARNSDKLIKLRMRLGPVGYAIYFMLLEKLAEATDHRLEEDYDLLSFDLRIDADKIQTVAEGYDLFAHGEGFFWSTGLDKRINAAKDISEKRRRAGMAGAQSKWQTDGKQMANTEQTDGNKNIIFKNKNNIINNNRPPQQQHACAREGSAEEEEEVCDYDLFARFDLAMSRTYRSMCIISATDDNRLRRYLTIDEKYLSTMMSIFDGYLVEQKDVTGLRQALEKSEKNGCFKIIDFEMWQVLSAVATLSKSDQKKIRQLVRSKPDGYVILKDAMSEIGASNGKIKMPSRYIISKLSES